MKRPVWPSLALLAAALAIAAVLYARGAPDGALLWLGACLLLHALFHAWHLQVLHRWAAHPRREGLPAGWGRWRAVFDLLRMQLREATQERNLVQLDRQQLRIAVDLLPDALIVLDDRKQMHWRNRAAAEMLKLPDEPRPIDHFIRTPEFIRYLNAGQFETPLTLALPDHPGRVFMLRVMLTPEAWRLLICSDITERHNMEAMQRDFVANVSHELRTPLTVINGTIETLIDLDLPRPQALKQLESARRQGEAMNRLTTELLMLSSLAHATLRPPDEDIDLPAMLQSLLAEARTLSAGRHTISLHCPAGVMLRGVAFEVESSIRNLLTNAIRYTPEGGRIDIRWRPTAQGGELSVQDTGIGIAAQHLPRLTERFYRVDTSRSRQSGGTGLGLAIVGQVARRHDATLTCRSQPGRGSRFALQWPARRILAPGESEAGTLPDADGSDDGDVLTSPADGL